MGLINWIFDFYQQSRIERLNDELADARLRTAGGGVDAAMPGRGTCSHQ